MRRLFLIAAYAVALTACGPTTTPATEAPQAPANAAEATAQDTCGAAQYASLVGSNFAAVTLPAGANIRIIQPDTMVTQDFSPERLNMITDANGIITSLECY
ncbi:MAG: I78 family peptidase inhibitor [Hyphomonadaceae bacterium]